MHGIALATHHALIGAHIIGEQAIELINIGLLPMQMNATFQAFIDACFNFPSPVVDGAGLGCLMICPADLLYLALFARGLSYTFDCPILGPILLAN